MKDVSYFYFTKNTEKKFVPSIGPIKGKIIADIPVHAPMYFFHFLRFY